MKTFVQWATEKKITLPILVGEQAAYRGGVRGQYPSGYLRSQYPDAYFAPITASVLIDLQNAKKVKDKAPPDDAP